MIESLFPLLDDPKTRLMIIHREPKSVIQRFASRYKTQEFVFSFKNLSIKIKNGAFVQITKDLTRAPYHGKWFDCMYLDPRLAPTDEQLMYIKSRLRPDDLSKSTEIITGYII